MDKKIVVIKYQDSFADNFSAYAYSKIMENKFPVDCFYENTTKKRKQFEKNMGNFNLNYTYISKSRADNISNSRAIIQTKDLLSNKFKKDKVLNLNHFRIDDIRYITDEIKSKFEFNNVDFIVNYDILEEIDSLNSVGLYINQNDNIDAKYVKEATRRLNKYLKKPKLYIFTRKNIDIDSYIEYKRIKLYNWKEEFYFLRHCKHKIIHCTDLSYSEGFWASILNSKPYHYTAFDRRLNPSKKFRNWIPV